jgi:YVTN family beta-propeller protein
MKHQRFVGITALAASGLLFAARPALSQVQEKQVPEGIGGKVYVTSWFGQWISVVDLDSGKATAEIKVGAKNHNVFMSPDQKQAWVTNYNEGTVSVVDTETDKVIKTFRTGGGPRHTFLTADGKYAYVTNELDANVAVIDAAELRVLTHIRVGGMPPRHRRGGSVVCEQLHGWQRYRHRAAGPYGSGDHLRWRRPARRQRDPRRQAVVCRLSRGQSRRGDRH